MFVGWVEGRGVGIPHTKAKSHVYPCIMKELNLLRVPRVWVVKLASYKKNQRLLAKNLCAVVELRYYA
jgi:hypothetical protein